ncbi:MAG TPA: DUF4397 domain-containing protein [Kineosporiaceae bacterium]|jgi:hypothetical protein|nr:DUF4397 domain-containing protein [Kineosporiaceae bacterium]
MRGASRRRSLAGLAVLVLAAAGAVAAATAAGASAPRAGAAASGNGQVYLVHGIVGTPVAVDLDGRRLAEAAQPKTVLGPISLPVGRHVVVLRTGTKTVTSASFTVTAGRSIDVVAHRAADAAQTARVVVFRNDMAPVAQGRTRLVVAHTAVAPPADVRVDGSVLFHDVASGESLSLVVPAKTYTVDVVPVAGSGTILAPVKVTLKPGTLTRVFAVGDPSNGTADAIVQVLPVGVGGSGVPSRVPTGDGGQAATSFTGDGPGRPLFAVLAVAVGVLLLLGRTLARAPSRHAR